MSRRECLNGALFWQGHSVDMKDRERLAGHAAAVLWFTGLSGSGKSTLASAVERRLHALAYRTFVLDGDNLRLGLCSDLGFSSDDRHENIRRAGEVAALFMHSGAVVLSVLISPFASDRARAAARYANSAASRRPTSYPPCPTWCCTRRRTASRSASSKCWRCSRHAWADPAVHNARQAECPGIRECDGAGVGLRAALRQH